MVLEREPEIPALPSIASWYQRLIIPLPFPEDSVYAESSLDPPSETITEPCISGIS